MDKVEFSEDEVAEIKAKSEEFLKDLEILKDKYKEFLNPGIFVRLGLTFFSSVACLYARTPEAVFDVLADALKVGAGTSEVVKKGNG